MTVQTQEIEYCKLQINYSADPSLVLQKREEALKEIKKQKIKLSGFRAGKAPDYAIKAKMKKSIDEWVVSQLVSEAYQDALFESKFKPIGQPAVDHYQLNDSQFWCTLSLLKRPEFELKEYKGLEIPKQHAPQSAEQLTQKQLQDLREMYGKNTPFSDNDVVAIGDKVTMDYHFKFENPELPPIDREGMLYRVGGELFPELDENLVGMKAGETKEFSFALGHTAPPELRGQKTTVTVTVHMGLKIELLPLDDELGKTAGYQNFDELYKTVNTMANNSVAIHENKLVTQQLVNRLLAMHEIKVPDWLINAEVQQLEMRQNFDLSSLNEEQQKEVVDTAAKSVKLALILESIKEKEPDVSFSDQEVIEVIKNHAASTGKDVEQFINDSVKNGSIVSLMASVRSEAVLNWLIGQSKIVD